MIILLLGPSGVGKTTSYRRIASELPQCVFCELDRLASRWAITQGLLQKNSVHALRSHINDDELFLAFGLEAIRAFAVENHPHHCVIDVGAGFQVARSAEYLQRIHKTIALTGDARAIYQRIVDNRGDNRSFENYRRDEFNERRRAVYNSCHYSIDTTNHSEDETAAALKSVIQTLLGSEMNGV